MPINPRITSPGIPVSRSRGTFSAGQTVLFYFDFPDINGILYDPIDLNVEIKNSSGNTVYSLDSLDHVDVGQYAFSWMIPENLPPGTYTLYLTYVINSINGNIVDTIVENFTISEKHQNVISSRYLALRAYLEEDILGYTQRIPVFDEIARLDKSRRIAKLTFPRWNQPAGVEVKINGELKERGYSVDYMQGKITFDYPLTEVDEVNVNYNFRWFSDGQLDGFVAEGINIVNLWPPQTSYDYMTIPVPWIITAMHASAVLAIRRLIMDLLFQEPQKVFGGSDKADKVLSHLDNLKKNYENWLEKMLDQKKKGPYLGLTKTIVVPEYTLPGGRSRWFRYLFKGP